MIHGDAVSLLLGAVVLGAVHGIEPGHGWPVAASYALDQSNKWAYGLAASLILGIGHLISSIAMVGVFFYAKGYFNLTQINEPIDLVGSVQIGGPVSVVAGVLLIALGVREYSHGHSHSNHEHSHTDDSHDSKSHAGHSHGSETHSETDHDHTHAHHTGDDGDAITDHSNRHTGGGESSERRLPSRLMSLIPFVGQESHSHSHSGLDGAADRGLFGIAWFAFVLGFAHEEEFEIIALCAGSTHCLELMGAYAVTVIVGIVTLTLLLIAGYQRSEETVRQYTPYLPAFSAAVLSIMGVGFIAGLL